MLTTNSKKIITDSNLNINEFILNTHYNNYKNVLRYISEDDVDLEKLVISNFKFIQYYQNLNHDKNSRVFNLENILLIDNEDLKKKAFEFSIGVEDKFINDLKLLEKLSVDIIGTHFIELKTFLSSKDINEFMFESINNSYSLNMRLEEYENCKRILVEFFIAQKDQKSLDIIINFNSISEVLTFISFEHRMLLICGVSATLYVLPMLLRENNFTIFINKIKYEVKSHFELQETKIIPFRRYIILKKFILPIAISIFAVTNNPIYKIKNFFYKEHLPVTYKVFENSKIIYYSIVEKVSYMACSFIKDTVLAAKKGSSEAIFGVKK